MRVVIGLGTNLGDRLVRLREAVARVEKIARVIARSSVYETAPVGPPQPDFLNAAILVEYTDSPHALLRALLAIEKEMGRDRRASERWGPREIDLDVLWIDPTNDAMNRASVPVDTSDFRDAAKHAIIDTPELKVPHPRLTERAFALVPLLEIAPHAIDPRTGREFPPPCEVLTKLAGTIG